MSDVFAQNIDSPTAPAMAPFSISPHDSDALPAVPKAIYVGTGGDITLRGAAPGAADVTFRNLASGQILPVRAAYVRATGTTASNLVAFA